MASSKPLVAIALLLLVALLMVADAQHQRKPEIDCQSACEARCVAKNWKNKTCNKDCNICCGMCGCVPSGTTQNTRKECLCYTILVNHETGKLKCP